MKKENPNFLADIEWIPFANGGRRNPPKIAPAEHYMAPASVGNWNGNNARSANWTLVVYDTVFDNEYRCRAKVEYLVEDAPHDSLQPGIKFELYEGRKCVAKGLIAGAVSSEK